MQATHCGISQQIRACALLHKSRTVLRSHARGSHAAGLFHGLMLMWRSIVARVGGIYDIGKLCILVHDRGVMFAWDSVVMFDIPRRPGWLG